MEFPFQGLVAAPFTPMKDDGDIDESKVGAYAQHLGSNGVKAVFVNGTTGEGVLSLSIGERKRMLEEHCPVIMAQVDSGRLWTLQDMQSHWVCRPVYDFFSNFLSVKKTAAVGFRL